MAKIKALTPAEEATLELEFADAIHAGFPSPAADQAGERIDLVHEMTHNPDTTFYAKVGGESMRDIGLLNGDIVVIDRSIVPQNGDIIVAAIDGEFTIKEFQMDENNNCVWLVPHNPEFEKIQVNANDNFMVWGVITHCIHRFHS